MNFHTLLQYKVASLRKQMLLQLKPSLEKASITYAELVTLMHVVEHPGTTQAQMADHMYRDRNAIGNLVDKLEKQGLLERRKEEQDRRSYHLFITEQGTHFLKPFKKEMAHIQRKTLQELSAGEQEQFLHLLNKLTKEFI